MGQPMTYRERREAKAERLRGWAGKREERAAEEHAKAHHATAGIPFGQPILVGHHSERRHRNAVEKGHAAMDRAVENARTAERMAEKANNIERAAKAAIYSDDLNAIERLREKLATLEAKRETMKADNAAFRKQHKADLKGMSAYERGQAVPHPSYELTNLGGNITRTRKRLERMEREDENPNPRGNGRWMDARYAGECAECNRAVEKGERMQYFRKTREVLCENCA